MELGLSKWQIDGGILFIHSRHERSNLGSKPVHRTQGLPTLFIYGPLPLIARWQNIASVA